MTPVPTVSLRLVFLVTLRVTTLSRVLRTALTTQVWRLELELELCPFSFSAPLHTPDRRTTRVMAYSLRIGHSSFRQPGYLLRVRAKCGVGDRVPGRGPTAFRP